MRRMLADGKKKQRQWAVVASPGFRKTEEEALGSFSGGFSRVGELHLSRFLFIFPCLAFG